MSGTHTSTQGLTFVNADLGGEETSLRIVGSRIASLGEVPQPDDLVIDLGGDRLLPGLINAHDHLQHNHFSGLRYRAHYTNVREWIEDVSSRMQTSTALRNSGDLPREHRLLQGAAKNARSGATTVAHHDPLYELLATDAYPISVVRHYGWSHSLFIDGDETVRRAYQQTPLAWPWIIHASEGLDPDAADEF